MNVHEAVKGIEHESLEAEIVGQIEFIRICESCKNLKLTLSTAEATKVDGISENDQVESETCSTYA